MTSRTSTFHSTVRTILGGASARRLVCSCFVVALAVAGLAAPVQAQGPGRARMRSAELELQRLIAQLRYETARVRPAAPPLIAGMPGTIGGGVDGGLTTTVEIRHGGPSKLDEFIGRRTQRDVNSARIRTLPVCYPRDRVNQESWCRY